MTSPGRLAWGGAVDAARAGDLCAWGHTIRHHQHVVFRTAYLATRDPAMAEEATKVAFARAYRSLHGLEQGTSLRPWLMGIAVVTARSHVRLAGQSRDARPPIRESCPRLPAAAASQGLARPRLPLDDEAALHDAFDGLTEQERLLLASRYAFDLTRADAASLLAIPAEQVDDRLAAAVGRLCHRLGGATATSTASCVQRTAPGRPVSRDPAGRLATLGDDQLAWLATTVALSALTWTPDVAPLVCDRLAREAIAYP